MKQSSGKFGFVLTIIIIALAVMALISTFAFFLAPDTSGTKDNGKDGIIDYSTGWKNESGIMMSLNGMIDSASGYTANNPLKIYKESHNKCICRRFAPLYHRYIG